MTKLFNNLTQSPKLRARFIVCFKNLLALSSATDDERSNVSKHTGKKVRQFVLIVFQFSNKTPLAQSKKH